VGEAPYASALDVKRGRLFVTNQQGSTVSVISPLTGETLATVNVGDYPEGIQYSVTRDRIYVASWFDNALYEINPESFKLERTMACGDGSRAFGSFIAE
jgi:YVTN family beta-propeller protein